MLRLVQPDGRRKAKLDGLLGAVEQVGARKVYLMTYTEATPTDETSKSESLRDKPNLSSSSSKTWGRTAAPQPSPTPPLPDRNSVLRHALVLTR
jgi:hypothetical protein